jgi:hypothetical protein
MDLGALTSFASTAAPAARSWRTTWRCSFPAAACMGVMPSCSSSHALSLSTACAVKNYCRYWGLMPSCSSSGGTRGVGFRLHWSAVMFRRGMLEAAARLLLSQGSCRQRMRCCKLLLCMECMQCVWQQPWRVCNNVGRAGSPSTSNAWRWAPMLRHRSGRGGHSKDKCVGTSTAQPFSYACLRVRVHAYQGLPAMFHSRPSQGPRLPQNMLRHL